MACSCGFALYTETVSGGVKCAGTATVTSTREPTSGGALCGGAATVSTNQVWDGYALVFHLEESGGGTEGEYNESACGHNAQGDNGEALFTPSQIQSIHSYGQRHDGNAYISVPHDGASPPFTISCWARREGRFLVRYLYSRGQSNGLTAEGWNVALGYDDAGRPIGRCQTVGASNWVRYLITGPDVLTQGCWYHLALVYGNNALTLYVDGQSVRTTAVTESTLAPSSAGSFIGRIDTHGYHDGDIDELRVYCGVLSDDWIETEFLNLCDSDFFTYGSQQQFGIS